MINAGFQLRITLPDSSKTTFTAITRRVMVGSDPSRCEIVLNEPNILEEHLLIVQDATGTVSVTNLGLPQSVYYKRKPVPPNTALRWRKGQTINIGNASITMLENQLNIPQASLLKNIGWRLSVTGLIILAVLFVHITQMAVNDWPNSFTVIFSVIFFGHSVFTLSWMLYGWNNPGEVNRNRSPETWEEPTASFTALIPARHEENVIQDTIKAVNNINYPEHLKQSLILCRQDDNRTIAKARQIIDEIGQDNIELVIFNSYPINKPHSLNQGLRRSRNEVIAVFDAEDEPHPDLYQIVNTIMVRDGADVVQSGVQLMNHSSHWFSVLNAMEYYFWFKSGLHFFTRAGKVTPLGGNSVFVKREYLKQIGGWDETCLTEDADVGIKLALQGAKIRIVYDERHATQEETPNTTSSFVRQRARWNQGFLQILLKGDWARLPRLRQRIVAGYILISPLIQALLMAALPIGLWIAFTTKLEVGVALISFTPLYMLVVQFVAHLYGLFEFVKVYKLHIPFWLPIVMLLTYYPYQIVLAFSAFRAIYRTIVNRTNWEKTAHSNAHRQLQPEIGAS